MLSFDVVVVGGGHAGCEAASAALRKGAHVALLTFSATRIGAMSCNPAIGGVGKGHLVREVDALGGVIAQAADKAAIHYRMLNRSKGVAVWGPRVQADRKRYAAAVQAMLPEGDKFRIIEGEAASLILRGGAAAGVILADGTEVRARTVVLATGTFLGGRIFRGEDRIAGGRIDERAATAMGLQLRDLGLPVDRMKTGTPPRLDGRTIDWGRLESQPSDRIDWTMSPISSGRTLPQLTCAITHTNERTHDIIRTSRDRSPLYDGAINAAGPRYCPSIEDKVSRFADRMSHQLFLEPEGLDDHLVYPNGISTSLPTDVQEKMIRSIAGLERSDIVVPGYAVEYDYLDPRALDHRLAVIDIPGVFPAGQVNGTTGYEEAAAQGLIAGANAAATALGQPAVLLDRSTSYIGVMIDDLVLQGVTEPYRMLTARAEHRLHLRADNAESRLSGIAEIHGLLNDRRLERLTRLRDDRKRLDVQFDAMLTARDVAGRGYDVAQDGSRKSIREWLQNAAIDPLSLTMIDTDIDPAVVDEAVTDARYRPYLDRLMRESQSIAAYEALRLDGRTDYAAIPGLSTEMAERLRMARPANVGAASRVRGISPAAISALVLYSKRLVAA